MKYKVVIVVGTRPEVVKLAPVYLALKKSKKIKPILINTGQHEQLVDDMLRWFGIKEDYNLRLMEKDQSLPSLTAKIINASTNVLKKIKPDLVLIEGDTTTVIASCLASFYLKIPVAHIEAGLRTDDIYNPFPEEMTRRLVSHVASIHFAPTKNALLNLRKENIKSNLHLTGNTVVDSLLYTLKQLKQRSVPPLLVRKKNNKLDFKKSRVVLVTMHRRENFGNAHREIAKTLIKILNAFPDTVLLLPLHMNPNVRSVIKPILENHKRVFLIEPPGYVPFVYVMQNSYLILTDSGGIQEEAPTLGKPVLVLRTKTERIEGIKAGSTKLVGVNPKKIFQETSKLLTNKRLYQKMARVKNPYGDGKASLRIVRTLEDYLK